jgi:hypothetical protein
VHIANDMILFLIILVITMHFIDNCNRIDEGRLKFRDHLNTGGHMSDKQIFLKGVINLKGKKILVRLSQAETTKCKNVIIDETIEKMKTAIKKLKPTFDELSAKYKKGNAHTKN